MNIRQFNGTIVAARGILLDMDGTLVNSERSVVESWNRLFQELGSSHTYVEAFHGIPARTLLRSVMPQLSEREIEDAFQRVEQYELDTADYVEVLPGTAQFLADLERAEAELGRPCWTIVTSCTRRLFEARFAGKGLPIPDTTVTADQVAHGKPHPEPYLTGAARIGVDPGECIVVEDAIPGITAGKEAGCITVGVSTTTSRDLVSRHAEHCLDTLNDVTVRVEGGELLLIDRTSMN